MCVWCVFNCEYELLLGSFDTKVYVWVYIYGSIYNYIMHIHYGFRAEMKFYAGTLTMKCVARLVMLFMRERMYATVSTVRSKIFPKFVRTYGTSMHHVKLPFT